MTEDIDKSMVSKHYISEFNRQQKILAEEFAAFKFLADHWQLVNFIEGKNFRLWTVAFGDVPILTFLMKYETTDDEAEDFAIYLAEYFEFAMVEETCSYNGLYWKSYKPITLDDGTQVTLKFQVSKTVPDKYIKTVNSYTYESYSCRSK